MSKSGKVIKIEQTGSPIRREHTQRETLIGLRLNKIGRTAELPGYTVDPRDDLQGEASRARSGRRRGSRCPSLPGLPRQSIPLRKKMDARVTPGHDGVEIRTVP